MYELCMKKRTTLQIENTTLKSLTANKKNSDETYDQLLNRIITERKEKANKMDMYIGEYVDRLSIHIHKCQKIGPEAYPEFIKYAEKFFLEINVSDFNEAIKGLRTLYQINGEIWKLESDLRQGKEGKLSLEECGRRAIAIRNWNNKRIAEQDRLIDLFGGFKNIKKDHISQDKK